MSNCNQRLDEILDSFIGFSTYTQNADGEFVPINWDNSPILAQAKQAIKQLIEDQMIAYQKSLLADYEEDVTTQIQEARIDELNRVPRISYSAEFAIHIEAYLDSRIAQLRSTQ